MTSLQYNDIYSRFYTKADAYDFLDIDDGQVNDFLCNWLHSACSKPYIRRLFSKISLDDEVMKISYEMRYVLDDESDNEFIIEILSHGILISWLEPKVNSIENILQTYGSKEEKFYSEANHLKELKDLKDVLKREQRQMIADRGGAWNTYLDGKK